MSPQAIGFRKEIEMLEKCNFTEDEKEIFKKVGFEKGLLNEAGENDVEFTERGEGYKQAFMDILEFAFDKPDAFHKLVTMYQVMKISKMLGDNFDDKLEEILKQTRN